MDTYKQDGRAPLATLFESFNDLVRTGTDWEMSVIYEQEIKQDSNKLYLPIMCLTTKQTGPALWILSGIHGEEPAGPNALARNTETILNLGKKIPIVSFPLLNPIGYAKNWRYPNEYRDWKKGTSVSSAEHVLLDFNKANQPQPRRVQPESKEAEMLISKVLELVKSYPPILSLDHHEDEALEYSYVYSQGSMGAKEPVAEKIINILKNSGIPIQQQGKTRFGEEVVNGVVQSTHDGSIDELMAAEKIIVQGQVVSGPTAPVSIVIETPVIKVPLEQRIRAHEAVIKSYEWLLVGK